MRSGRHTNPLDRDWADDTETTLGAELATRLTSPADISCIWVGDWLIRRLLKVCSSHVGAIELPAYCPVGQDSCHLLVHQAGNRQQRRGRARPGLAPSNRRRRGYSAAASSACSNAASRPRATALTRLSSTCPSLTAGRTRIPHARHRSHTVRLGSAHKVPPTADAWS